jgi:signal transduction histidine kinase
MLHRTVLAVLQNEFSMPLPVPAKTRRRLAFLFSLPAVFSLVFFGVELFSERTDIHLLEIQNLQTSISELSRFAKDAESAERGFLLTGERAYLRPLNEDSFWLHSRVDACKNYAVNHPDLLPSIQRVAELVQDRLTLAKQLTSARDEKDFAAAIEREKAGDPDHKMNELQNAVNKLLVEIRRIEQANLDRVSGLNRWTFIFFSVGTMVMIAVMVWLYNALLSYVYARDDARAQLEKVNSDLQNRIDNRTRELEEMNSELQQFAYVASHDLQEPLRTITSFSQLLASRYRGKLDADADEFIGYIVTASRRMTDLINGLLQLVRLRKNSQPIAAVPFERLLEEAEISLQAAIRESGARIEHGVLPSLVVDPVQFSQVLQNLIANAIRYRSAAPPFIQIIARRDRGNWIFSVTDNGCGFDQEFAERIFGLFQRLHGREVEGTGMGLSISRKIVERHGGRIWAESKEGEGSTFFFSLPITLEGLRFATAVAGESSLAQTR